MDILDRVNKTISDAGQKTRNSVDIANLNWEISNNEKQMNQLYEQLGELYYNAHSDDPEQDFPEIVGNITDLQDQIDDLNDQIQQLKGYVKCPNCGAVITDQDVMFCQYCGARLDRQSEQEQTVIQEPGLIRCKCGAILEKDDMFCSKCGTSREELEKLQNGYTEE